MSVLSEFFVSRFKSTLLSLGCCTLLVACGGESPQDTDATQDNTQQTSTQAATGPEAGDKSDDAGSTPDSGSTSTPPVPVKQDAAITSIDVLDFILVSSRRTGRTRMEYTVRLRISNASSNAYENVLATLVSAPGHVNVVDGLVNIGDVPGNATINSLDTFTFDADLTVLTGLDEFSWSITGDAVSPPGPGPGPGPTQEGIFMDIDDGAIPGESRSDSHRDWIELLTLSEGIHLETGSPGGDSRQGGTVELDGMTGAKWIDRSSPLIRDALADGDIFGEVRIDVIKSCNGNPYTRYAITLETASIVAIDLASSTADDRPTEEVAFYYSRITSMYTPVDRDCTLGSPVYSTQDGPLLR